MARTTEAWRRLVSEGWFTTRDEAVRWILSDKVRAGPVRVTSAGQRVPDDAPLTVRGMNLRYVSKGGLKLEGALQAFGVNVSDRVCIDAGASTGGFTDCLLQRGAARVYAVDVGYGQIAGSLRGHPSVCNLERTNIADDALLTLDPQPTLGTIDLSYLSLRKAVPQFARIMHGHGDLLCLVKPLFEVDDVEARRTGHIRADAYEPLLSGLANSFVSDGYQVAGICASPVTGNHGTLEFFLWLQLAGDAGLDAAARSNAIAHTISTAHALPAYRKPGMIESD